MSPMCHVLLSVIQNHELRCTQHSLSMNVDNQWLFYLLLRPGGPEYASKLQENMTYSQHDNSCYASVDFSNYTYWLIRSFLWLVNWGRK